MDVRFKRRHPRRRRTIPREVPMEVETYDPRDETADIFHRPTEHEPRPREKDKTEAET